MRLFLLQFTALGLLFASVYLLVRHGSVSFAGWMVRQERWYERVLNHQLLIDINPRVAVGMSLLLVVVMAIAGYAIASNALGLLIGAGLGLVVPYLVIRHLEQKRAIRLDQQIVSGITTLASGVRAGLNFVQAMELLVNNSVGPIKQEFAQLLREYQMGRELNLAMQSAANRIGLSSYRLLFTALEMHRLRGGNAGESLDRIAESIREIQRLEGKLDALTSQGRSEARMIAAMPLVIMLIYYTIEPDSMQQMLIEPLGRLLLLVSGGLILVGFFWIRKIMMVDI